MSARTAWLLVQAARHIVENGHHRGDMAPVVNAPPETLPCCAHGAINVAAGCLPWETTDEAREAVDAVEEWLHVHSIHESIDGWSDDAPTGDVVNGLLTVALREHTVWSDGARTVHEPLLTLGGDEAVCALDDDDQAHHIPASVFFADYRPVES